MSGINPQVKVIEIGTRKLKEITIYPLSMADQFRLVELISSTIKDYDPGEDASDVEIFESIMDVIKDNLIPILEFVTEDKVTLDDLTNEQFASLCELIYEMNFEGAVGKFKSLFKKVKTALPLKRQSQNSSSAPTTDTNTSSEEATEKEE